MGGGSGNRLASTGLWSVKCMQQFCLPNVGLDCVMANSFVLCVLFVNL